MRKCFLLMCMQVLFFTAGITQNFNGSATYSVKLVEDGIRHNAELLFNAKTSRYFIKEYNASVWRIDTTFYDLDGTYVTASQKIYTDAIGHVVSNSQGDGHLIIRDFCKENEPVLYKDSVEISWKIMKAEKKIGLFKCNKATTKFRGRKYEVWFTREVPVPYGPWKFHGLPGLIVEVRDSKNDVQIELTSFSLSDEIEGRLNWLNGAEVELSRKVFVDCQNTQWKNSIKKELAKFAQIRADYPDLEVELDVPKKRPATELDYE